MIWTTVVLWLLTAYVAYVAYRRGDGSFQRGLKIGWSYALGIGPRIVMALILAGILVALTPGELIAPWLGHDAGFGGILLASVVGGFVPGGPVIAFPIVLALYKAGVGVPQLVAFLSGWSVVAMHRVIAFEIPLLGWRFSAARLLVSVILPPLSGVFAELLMSAVVR